MQFLYIINQGKNKKAEIVRYSKVLLAFWKRVDVEFKVHSKTVVTGKGTKCITK